MSTKRRAKPKDKAVEPVWAPTPAERARSIYYKLTDHVCVSCLGRVLEHVRPDARRVFRCANCGMEAEGGSGRTHPPICCCSQRMGERDAGVRCVINGGRWPEALAEIVATEGAT